jgi:hypothetical protein
MNIDKFIEEVKEIGEIYCLNNPKNGWDDKFYSYCGNKKINLDKNYLYIYWRTGGEDGGSCWDDGTEDNHHPISADPEPEFKSLDKLLIKLCPNISYLQYKRIVSSVIKTGKYTQNEYYGNYTTYSYKAILLRDLFNILNEFGY